jgi:CheY-like chemotaxis protein
MNTEKRILVVDDDRSVRRMLRRVLTGEGYYVQTAANGATALEIANTTPIDLVLLDLSLPERSGWEVFARLARMRPLLPVVIITAKSNQLFTALAAGVGALLEKPLRIPEMLRTVSHLLAESIESRLARVKGKLTQFHYLPAWPEAQPSCGGGTC